MPTVPLLRAVSLVLPLLWQAPPNPPAQAAGPYRFETQQIRDDFGVGYAVTVADVNGDEKPDILAISGTQLVWFENPSWQAHVVLDGQTPKDNVTLAPHDIDRDGRLDVALGATWKPSDTNGGGTLHWASPGAPGASLDAARHHLGADAASHPLGERSTAPATPS